MGNSRANGQAERAIRAAKDIIRRYLSQERTAYWTDALPYCLIAMHHTPAAAHGFPPFTVITGTTPILPTSLPDPQLKLPGDADPQREELYVQHVLAHAKAIREETGERLLRRDARTRAALRRRAMRGEYPATLFHF